MAANPLRGEVEFEAGGQTRKVKFTTNVVCGLEGELLLSVDEISDRLVRGHLSVLRSAMRAALGGKLRHDDVGDLIDEIGPRRATELLLDALKLAFPAPEEGGGNPPQGAEAGTGASS